MAEKSRELSVKIDVDVSEALTGLKAVERQAKKATQAIRELETVAHDSYYESEGIRLFTRWLQRGDDVTGEVTTVMSDIPSSVLSRELAKREGVTSAEIATADTQAIEITVDYRRCGE